MIDTAPLLTYAECAERLHVSLSAAQRLGRSGALDVVRLGPQTHRIRESSLQRLIERRSPPRGEAEATTAA